MPEQTTKGSPFKRCIQKLADILSSSLSTAASNLFSYWRCLCSFSIATHCEAVKAKPCLSRPDALSCSLCHNNPTRAPDWLCCNNPQWVHVTRKKKLSSTELALILQTRSSTIPYDTCNDIPTAKIEVECNGSITPSAFHAEDWSTRATVSWPNPNKPTAHLDKPGPN
jgi:hypothetical protein